MPLHGGDWGPTLLVAQYPIFWNASPASTQCHDFEGILCVTIILHKETYATGEMLNHETLLPISLALHLPVIVEPINNGAGFQVELCCKLFNGFRGRVWLLLVSPFQSFFLLRSQYYTWLLQMMLWLGT